MNIRDTHPLGEVPGERAIIERLAARLSISQPEAELAAGAVLAALEDHLAPEETEALEAELPVVLRRAAHRVEKVPTRVAHDTSHLTTAEEFYRTVAGRLHSGFGDVHPLILAVFDELRGELSERVRNMVANRLGPDLRALWLGNM